MPSAPPETPAAQSREEKPEEIPEEGAETISIRNVLKGRPAAPANTPAEEKTVTQKEVRKKPFDVELLRKKWGDYADTLAHDKPRLAAALRHHHPGMTGENTIRITVENKNLKEDFENNLKPDLMDYLRKELENDTIVLQIDVEKLPDGSKKPYTPEEKYEYMKKKNPEIEGMRKMFDLDLE